ncbi:MAG: hypothetical protein EP344_08540 [Bacteroidetes bacterium]|nr:MAG: hypothetical protein EP344_08540 [Bacteroidota bacterium]
MRTLAEEIRLLLKDNNVDHALKLMRRNGSREQRKEAQYLQGFLENIRTWAVTDAMGRDEFEMHFNSIGMQLLHMLEEKKQ